MNWYILIAIHIACMIVASGIRGGVRDEMDGIIDMLAIALWPIWIAGFLIWTAYTVLFSVGSSLRRAKK